MMSRADDAVNYFNKGYACSQAVLSAFAPMLDLNEKQARRIAAGFAAGMRVAGVCGAVSGAIMVLGLALGEDECITREGRAGIAASVDEFVAQFLQRNKFLNCPDILGCDVRTLDGRGLAQAQGWFASKCATAVRDAAEILDKMMTQR
jgi:C_GCAxxG_C_C family probable redox protein